MELLINVVFAVLLGIGLGSVLSAMIGLLWMFWDMFKPKKRD